MALTKVSRQMTHEKVVSSRDFGVLGDGVTNDASAFRTMWNWLRDEWYDNGQSYRIMLDGEIVIDNPTEDLAGVAAFIMDFPGTLQGNLGATISVNNLSSTTMDMFQIGTYASRNVGVRDVRQIKLDCNNACCGFTFADLFQGRGQGTDIQVYNSDAAGQWGIRVCNVQELWAQRWTMNNCDTGLKVEGGASVARAEGSDGSYSTGTGTAANNNNQFNGMFVQVPDEYGIWINQAENCSFSGLVQGNWNQWAFYCSGGDDIRLYDMWFETAQPSHQEIQFTASYNGKVIIENVHGTSNGCDAVFNGGEQIFWTGGLWLGQCIINDPSIKLITDGQTFGGGTVFGEYVELDEARSVYAVTDETKRNMLPSGRTIYNKQTIPASTTEFLHRFGNNSTSNTSKGGWGTLHVINDGTGAQVVIEFFFTAQGPYPACTTVITDKIGTQAGATCAFTITRSGSSPNHIVDIQLQNTDASNTISCEFFFFPTIF